LKAQKNEDESGMKNRKKEKMRNKRRRGYGKGTEGGGKEIEG
jgi:hypothetical protein